MIRGNGAPHGVHVLDLWSRPADPIRVIRGNGAPHGVHVLDLWSRPADPIRVIRGNGAPHGVHVLDLWSRPAWRPHPSDTWKWCTPWRACTRLYGNAPHGVQERPADPIRVIRGNGAPHGVHVLDLWSRPADPIRVIRGNGAPHGVHVLDLWSRPAE